MKSCLKTSSLPGSPVLGSSNCRKCVAFNPEGFEEVHWADEWDRTPTEPARKLSYQEVLELKEIQQSLPHAAQPEDALRPAKQLLSMVPIGLLPLGVPSETTSPSPVSPPPNSPTSYQTPFVMPPGRVRSTPPAARLASSTLTHLRPLAPSPPRARPAFAFLPLLSPSPPSSSAASPASETPGSGGSYFPYPPARAAADGEPDRVLPASLAALRRPSASGANAHPGIGYEHAYRAAEAAAYSPPFGSSAYDYARDPKELLAPEAKEVLAPAGKKKTKKSFMLINDVEVEIEEEDEEDEPISTHTPTSAKTEPTPPPIATPTVTATESEPIQPPISIPTATPAKTEPAASTPTRPPLIASAANTNVNSTPSPPSPSMRPTEKSAPPPLYISRAPEKLPPAQTSPRLAARPLSPPPAPRPLSPIALARAGAGAAGRMSPVQARASSRLVRV
ncbi:hypothetical protein DFH09DRAFT_1467421 [Mycena vulgaris]|nr:hypothetical protein DFH09DRAFT_1467421 [Mycena vulgaris]